MYNVQLANYLFYFISFAFIIQKKKKKTLQSICRGLAGTSQQLSSQLLQTQIIIMWASQRVKNVGNTGKFAFRDILGKFKNIKVCY